MPTRPTVHVCSMDVAGLRASFPFIGAHATTKLTEFILSGKLSTGLLQRTLTSFSLDDREWFKSSMAKLDFGERDAQEEGVVVSDHPRRMYRCPHEELLPENEKSTARRRLYLRREVEILGRAKSSVSGQRAMLILVM